MAEGESLESTSGLVASLVLGSNYSQDSRKSLIQLFQKEYKKGSSDMVRSIAYTLAHSRPHTGK